MLATESYQRTHSIIPALPSGYEIAEEWAVVIPEATTNLIVNPSFELEDNALDGYSPGAPTVSNLVPTGTTLNIPDGTTYQPGPVLYLYGTVDLNNTGVLDLSGSTSITRVTSHKRRGGYGLQVVWGVTYEYTLTAGTAYTFSADVYAPTAATYVIRITDIATGYASEVKTRLDGIGWGRLAVTKANALTTGVHLLSIQRLDGGTFYTDGWQLEAKAYATTYADGDMVGYGRGVAYGWTAGAHTSTSTRNALTNSGGREVKLRDLGLILTAVAGMGLAPPIVSALGGFRDGSQYDNTRFDNRSFSLGGWIQQVNRLRYAEQLGRLSEALRPRRSAWDEPLRFHVTPKSNGVPLTNGPLEVTASYTGGLEGATTGDYGQPVLANFVAFLPYVLAGGNDATSFASYDTITANNILQVAPDGTVSNMAGGSDNIVDMVILTQAGRYIASGIFTTIGGVTAGGIAEYDPATGDWTALGTGVTSGSINTILEDAEGNIFAGGNFSSIGGVSANNVAMWNGTTWAAIGSGTNGPVDALALSRDGGVFIGGTYTTANGVAHARIVKYMPDGTWLALGTGASGPVKSLLYSRWGELYIGGEFATFDGTTVGRVARWDGTDAYALGSGFNLNSVNALAIGTRGELYAGGSFTQNGAGDTMPGLAVYEGDEWQALGSGLQEVNTLLDVTVHALAIASDGSLLVGGVFDVAGGITLPDRLAQWRNGAWYPLPLDLFGTATPRSLLYAPDGTFTIGYDTEGAIVTPNVATVTNAGTADAYPYKIEFSGPCRLVALQNLTTGDAIYFDYLTLLTGEVATLNLTPGKITFTSSWRGNILNEILPGSSLSSWHLAPGANLVSVQALIYDVDPQPDTVMEWRTGYAALEHGTYTR